MSRAGALRHVGRIEEAIIDCDELVKRIGDATEPRLVGCVVDGLHVKASALADSGRFDEAVEVLHGIVTRYSDATEPGLAIDVAWALHGKGRMLTKAGRVGEAIASYDDLVARLGDPTDAGELALAATTLNDEADLLLTADRTDAATAVYREVVARFGGTSDPSVILQVRRAQRAGEEVSNSNGPRPTAAVPAEALIGIRRTIAGTAFDSLTDAELTEDVQAVCEPHADFDSVVANRAEQVNADPQGRDSIGYANALSAARALSCPDSVAS